MFQNIEDFRTAVKQAAANCNGDWGRNTCRKAAVAAGLAQADDTAGRVISYCVEEWVFAPNSPEAEGAVQNAFRFYSHQ